jgi:hypothetical protein
MFSALSFACLTNARVPLANPHARGSRMDAAVPQELSHPETLSNDRNHSKIILQDVLPETKATAA